MHFQRGNKIYEVQDLRGNQLAVAEFSNENEPLQNRKRVWLYRQRSTSNNKEVVIALELEEIDDLIVALQYAKQVVENADLGNE